MRTAVPTDQDTARTVYTAAPPNPVGTTTPQHPTAESLLQEALDAINSDSEPSPGNVSAVDSSILRIGRVNIVSPSNTGTFQGDAPASTGNQDDQQASSERGRLRGQGASPSPSSVTAA